MTLYSPLRIASSEFGKLSMTLEPESKTLPTELVREIPVSHEHINMTSKTIIINI